VQQISHLSI